MEFVIISDSKTKSQRFSDSLSGLESIFNHFMSPIFPSAPLFCSETAIQEIPVDYNLELETTATAKGVRPI
jgi:hypothetical protein